MKLRALIRTETNTDTLSDLRDPANSSYGVCLTLARLYPEKDHV